MEINYGVTKDKNRYIFIWIEFLNKASVRRGFL
jgi:hypothetical protein